MCAFICIYNALALNYLFYNRCVATVLYRASFTRSFLFIGCLSKKNNRLLVTLFSLYPCIWITSLSLECEEGWCFHIMAGWAIVYCMSLRVLIERNTNTKYANTKKLYSTRRIKKKVFFFIDWIIDLRCLNITGCDSRVRLNEITSSIHHMTGMKSHVDFGTARGCFIIIWACGKTLKKNRIQLTITLYCICYYRLKAPDTCTRPTCLL